MKILKLFTKNPSWSYGLIGKAIWSVFLSFENEKQIFIWIINIWVVRIKTIIQGRDVFWTKYFFLLDKKRFFFLHEKLKWSQKTWEKKLIRERSFFERSIFFCWKKHLFNLCPGNFFLSGVGEKKKKLAKKIQTPKARLQINLHFLILRKNVAKWSYDFADLKDFNCSCKFVNSHLLKIFSLCLFWPSSIQKCVHLTHKKIKDFY